MTHLIFSNNNFSDLRTALLQSDLETSAIALANVGRGSERTRLLVREIHRVPDDEYAERTPLSAVLKPTFLAPLAKQARLQKQALVFIHTHPGSGSVPSFSVTDDRGEQLLKSFLDKREANAPHAALVLNRDYCRGRLLATHDPVQVLQVGPSLTILFDTDNPSADSNKFDRQVRAFGKHGQAILRKLRVGIVGLGGTGSVIAQQLAHLGVENYLLIDPDVVEESNLNRLVGASIPDVGASKVEVASRHIKQISPSANVKTNGGSVLDVSTARLLIDTDFLFYCTDSHGSRAVLNQLAYQYLVPAIDVGVTIATEKGKVSHVAGRAQMLSPGLSCLTCANFLNADAVRRDLMTSFQRQADPYFIGNGEPEPAVISLNSTVSSMAITTFLAAVTGIPIKTRYQIYNAITGNVRAVASSPDPVCIVCSKRGALARGDEWPLPARPG